ncbi:DUF4011 domain-containing protein [Prauserella alba]|uniref:DUF3320 domain-containing protein n=1 Tax=Prauserella alba TaxID=176898 RepID=A0ABN1V1K8_9PSEU|nr:DUF4011 domain-containing protein [Prauserella alba]MCP2178880.1 hypothetical protein [Prauserella alba]
MTVTQRNTAAAQDGRLSVELAFPPAINYALVHNDVPLARYLRVENLTDEDLPGIDVRVELLGPDGQIATWHRTIPHLHARSEVLRVDFADLAPGPDAVGAADEAYPVHYRVLVRAGGTRLRAEARSRVLARNEWFNAPSLYESIAAFVQPNTASVDHVLRSARDLLERETGSSSLEGYQAGRQRAAQIGGAVYEALRAQRISYVGLPASFEDTGQKVRTTADVLGGQLGNCLDLSVTYAACLEQAGLHPLIWIVSGHAFAGFFLEEERLPETVSLDPNHMINLMESRRALAVELTGIGPGTGSKDYAEALRAGTAQFRSREHLYGMVDVALTHRTAIKALPSDDRRTSSGPADAEGSVQSHTLALPDELVGSGTFDVEQNLASREDATDQAPERIKRWRKSLLDLSLRNPLLKLPARGKGLDLHVPHDTLAALDDLVHSGKPVRIVPEDRVGGVQQLSGVNTVRDLPDESVADELERDHRIYGRVPDGRYIAKMRELQREARTIQQETGSNYLYLTFGTLVHPGASGEAHAPLFLLPVRIEGGSGRSPYTIVADGDEISAPNYCLIEWLRVKHGVRIPELENPPLDEDGIDIVRSFEAIRSSLVENDLHYRLDERASLRLLQFSTFQMWRDLTDHWERFMTNPIVRHLVTKPGHQFADPAATTDDNAFDEAALQLPIPADGSQMRAITMAAKDRSFVLEGPPGTGKSQTITNLIAHALRSGKRVLFVAEKQAALDVVKRRLGTIGLSDFCLDLHGRKQSLASIREQLNTARERTVQDDEHGWAAAEARYRQNVRALRDYPRRLHEENAARFSAWSAYAATTAHGDGPTAPVPPEIMGLDEQRRQAVSATVAELPAAAEAARLRAQHPWSLSGHRTVDTLKVAELTAAADELETVRELFHRLPEQLRSELTQLSSPVYAGTALPCARLARQHRLPGQQATSATTRERWDAAVGELLAELEGFQRQHAAVLATFRPEAFAHPDLPAWVTEAGNTNKGLFGKKKKRRRLAERLQPHLREGTTLDPEAIRQTVTAAAMARDHAAVLHQRFVAVPGLELPFEWSPAQSDAIAVVERRRDALVAGRELRAHSAGLWQALHELGRHAPVAELERFVKAWGNWFRLLTPGTEELRRWCSGRSWPEAWNADGPRWREELRTHGLLPLQRWGAVLAHTDLLTGAGLTDFCEQILTGALPAHELEVAYLRGLAGTALRERLQTSQLEYFDTDTHEHHVDEYLRFGGELEKLLPTRLASELLARRPRLDGDREFLRHITTSRRGANRLSFRQLLAKYPDEITGLTPCFLMSPASVANFLPPGAVEFDLVVFDEASQIRVAQAVGAMGRARSVVVVGDSKQMPPSSIMEAGHGEGDEEAAAVADGADDAVPADLDSILEECVESGLDREWLSWHYRSSDESLIAFSNQHYYENKLHTLPAPGSWPHAGITWRRLDGAYDRGGTRTNVVEARAIADQIAALLADPVTSERSIGVVTFNVPQRDLVLNLLEDSDDPNVQYALSREDEPLFVKNLENVQGDERDTVLFTLAFSRNPDTGQLPLNFGPLNNAGGERRLNVAVTRAREQVMLFSSFDPHDIDLARSNATGIRHLRAYLELAAGGFDQFGGIEASDPRADDRILSEVADAVRARGYEVATNVGLSQFTVDIAVRHADSRRWQVAVLLDGPEWASRLTVADRDRAPQLLGAKMRWPSTVRVWLPAWVRERAAVLERIDEAIARSEPDATAVRSDAGVGGAKGSEAGVPTSADPDAPPVKAAVPTLREAAVQDGPYGDSDGASPTHIQAPGSLPADREAVVNSATTEAPQPQRAALASEAGVPFVPYEPRPVGVKEDLDRLGSDAAVQRQLEEMFVEVTNFEGPVEINRLAKKALHCFGLGRVRENRVLEALEHLPSALRTERSPVGIHVWPADLDPHTWRGFRETQRSSDRAVQEIAPHEIINAIRHASNTGGPGERVLREALRLLGHTKMTEAVEDHIVRVLDFGVGEGLLPSSLGRR